MNFPILSQLKILSVLFVVMITQKAHAQRLDVSKSETGSGAAMVSLVEMNPADLLWGRYRLSYENLIFEGVSFAWTGEIQESFKRGQFEEKNLATGISLQYYPQSVSLTGLFLRGESDVSFATVREDPSARRLQETGDAAVLRLAGDVGWRVRLSERLTGSAAYGLRTTLSESLWSNESQLTERWLREKTVAPDIRVQINLGVVL